MKPCISEATTMAATFAEDIAAYVTRNGRAVTGLQPYLGAYGHLVALHAGDLAYSHVHPVGESLSAGTITFDAELHKAGPYRLFMQFQTNGRVHTVAFTQEASR